MVVFIFPGEGGSHMVGGFFCVAKVTLLQCGFPFSGIHHGQALKTYQFWCGNNFSKIWSFAWFSLDPAIVFAGKNQPFLHNRSILFVLGQNHGELCGRVTFSTGPRAGCTTWRICSESYRAVESTGLSWTSHIWDGQESPVHKCEEWDSMEYPVWLRLLKTILLDPLELMIEKPNAVQQYFFLIFKLTKRLDFIPRTSTETIF